MPGGHVRRHRDGVVQAGIWHRSPRHQRQGEDPGPHRQVVVLLLVHWIAATDLGRDLLERYGQYRGRGQLPAVARPNLRPTTWNDVLDQRAKRFVLLLGIRHQGGAAEDHDGPVIEGVMERGSGKDHAIDQDDGDTHRHAGPYADAATTGTVQVDGLSDACIAGGDRVGLSVDGEGDVADEALVEDGVDGAGVVAAPLGQPPQAGGVRGRVHRVPPPHRRPSTRAGSLLQYRAMNVLARYQVTGRHAQEIVASVEAAVHAGQLAPGDALPTVRELAAELEVSPGTVAAAYAALRRRGLVVTAGRRRTRVSGRPPPPARAGPPRGGAAPG